MKSNKKQQNSQINSTEQVLDNADVKENVSAQEDGFRYDYDDSSDVK